MTQVTILLEEQDAEGLVEYLDMLGDKEFEPVIQAILAALPFNNFDLPYPSWTYKFYTTGPRDADVPLSESLGNHSSDDSWWAIRNPPGRCTHATASYWLSLTDESCIDVIAWYRHSDRRRETDRSLLD